MVSRQVANEIALVCRAENLFRIVAMLESFDFATQENGQSEIALSSLINQITALHEASFAQWLKQRKLVIVQFRKRDAFRIAIKLFVLLVVGHSTEFTPVGWQSKRNKKSGFAAQSRGGRGARRRPVLRTDPISKKISNFLKCRTTKSLAKKKTIENRYKLP